MTIGALLGVLLACAPQVQAQELLSQATLAELSRQWLSTEAENAGLRAGAFDVAATAGMGLGFDSNAAAAADSEAESMGLAHALLYARNRGSQHEFQASGYAQTRRYADSRVFNASEGGLGLEYASWFNPRDQLEVSLSAEKRFERRGEIETPDDIPVSRHQDLRAEIRHTHVFNRLSLSAGADSRRIGYSAGSQQYRDRWQHRGELRSAYELRGNLSWTATGWFNRDDFDASSPFTDSADSIGALLGVRFDLRDVFDLEFGAGWFERRFDSLAAPLDGLALRGALHWQPTRLTRAQVQLSREDEPSWLGGSFAKVRNALELSVAHDFSRTLTLFAGMRAAHDEFARIGREDQVYAAEAGAQWLIGRHSLLRFSVGHASREPDKPQEGFSRQIASLSFMGRL